MDNKQLLEQLRLRGILKVEISYNGYGDEGCIEDISYFGPNDEPLTAEVGAHLSDLIDECVCDILNEQWPGWEINEGSSGTATIQVTGGRIEIDHNQHYIGTESDSYEGDL